MNKSGMLATVLLYLASHKLTPAEAKSFRPAVCGTAKTCQPCPELKLETVLYGHFLSPQSEDALIGTSGCEAHATDFGGSVLLTKRNGAWQKLWYEPGLISRECAIIKAGRDVPVCMGGHAAQGELTQVLFTVNFQKGDRFRKLLGVQDTRQACADEAENGHIERVSLDATGITAQVTHGKKKPTAAELKACQSDFEHPHITVPVKSYQVRFVLKGDDLILDDAAKPSYKIVNAEW